jgi:Protein of unknown function (DUF3489)
MSREHNTSKSPGSAHKLSDTQLVLLSAAAQRNDHCLTSTPKLKGGAARNVAEKLIAAGLVEEIKAKAGTPIWRRDEETAQSFALRLTAAGLKAIAVDDAAIEEQPGEPTFTNSEPPHSIEGSLVIVERELSGRDESEAVTTSSGVIREGVTPSIPRPGSKLMEVIELLRRDHGATIDELIGATDWLPHTTRAALTGLRKRGYSITRDRSDGATRYAIRTSNLSSDAPNANAGSGDASASGVSEEAA